MGKHLVIVGAGHAHLTVLKNLKEFKNSGHEVTVVSASPLHWNVVGDIQASRDPLQRKEVV